MARIISCHGLLTWAFVLASCKGTQAVDPSQVEAKTKHVNGVPIYNYWAASSVRNDSIRERDRGSRWFVQAVQDSQKRMREICAFTALGKKHCHYVAENMPAFLFEGSEDELAKFLAVHSNIIEFVEPDLEVNIADEMVPMFGGVQQSDPQWHLDRIDQYRGLSTSYVPGIQGGGGGAHVYILDTGVRTTHQDFEGRAVPAFDVTSGRMVVCNPRDTTCAADTHGHGTHCAGIVGGKAFGVAKNVFLHAGKVLNPSGSTGNIVMGIDWIISHGQKPAVISMSLGGGGRAYAYKTAIDASYSAGVTVVVAAGNSASDACGFSPAYVPNAITVGSSRAPTENADPISYFSNYGGCVDIFAPGSDIKSCGHQGDNYFAVMSGTSMACPAVAGAAALLLVAQPGIQPGQVANELKARAAKIRIVGERGYAKPNSPGLLLYVGKDWIPALKCPSGWFQVGGRGDDVPGWGLRQDVWTAPSINVCAQRCIDNQRCGDFEYQPQTQYCVLNDIAHSFPGSQTKTGWAWSITCKQTPPPYVCPRGWAQVGQVHDDVPGWGLSVEGNKAYGIQDCARQCVEDSRCGDFEYQYHTTYCALNDRAHSNPQSQTGYWRWAITCKPVFMEQQLFVAAGAVAPGEGVVVPSMLGFAAGSSAFMFWWVYGQRAAKAKGAVEPLLAVG